jgi:hypothetical protein
MDTLPPAEISARKIGRLAFALRFAGVFGAAVFVSILAFAAIVIAARGHATEWVYVLAALSLAANLGLGFLVTKYAVFPRLRDVGIDGALLWVALALAFVPVINTLLLLALLAAPAGFAHPGIAANDNGQRTAGGDGN